MSRITITDQQLVVQLQTTGYAELTDSEGRIIGRFLPEGIGKLPPGVKSPFTEEEMAERRKDRSGRPLADILRDLEARG
jgi:hypothetical protein